MIDPQYKVEENTKESKLHTSKTHNPNLKYQLNTNIRITPKPNIEHPIYQAPVPYPAPALRQVRRYFHAHQPMNYPSSTPQHGITDPPKPSPKPLYINPNYEKWNIQGRRHQQPRLHTMQKNTM